MLSIEWDSDFHSDGRRRKRPKASTVHGWLAKMRGTLLGNERLRSRGMREMKEARAIRRYKKQKRAQASRRRGGILSSLFGGGGKKRKASVESRALVRREPSGRRGSGHHYVANGPGGRGGPPQRPTQPTRHTSRRSTRDSTRSVPQRRSTKDSSHSARSPPPRRGSTGRR
ncbi:hypothetical protein PLICRDRAFT_33769 [Plicaturopsis crispa FD-325 SS-3]|nr:hypothetical protein PLICRDRAFT_33769 [Plicaturopsis crispa FD-325 SS-3]